MSTAESDKPGINRSGSAGGLRRIYLSVIVLVIITAGVYSNSMNGVFLLDDKNAIKENLSIRQLWPIEAILTQPRPASTVGGRPTVNFSLAINYAIGGKNIFGYHVANIIIHLLATLTLFGIIRRTLVLAGIPDVLKDSSTGLAFSIALLWSIHPLQTSAVTYIIQRAEALMALFYLLTLYCVIRSEAAKAGALLWQVLAVICCVLGMASKEVMVSAPIIVLLYDRMFLTGSFKQIFRKRSGMYIAMAGSWFLLAHLVISTGGRAESAGFDSRISVWDYAVTQIDMICCYLKLVVWPDPLIFDYGMELVTDVTEVLPQEILLLAFVAAVIIALIYQPRLGLLGLSFFAILAPSSSIIPIATQTGAEHRMYLPLMAPITIIVITGYMAITHLKKQFQHQRSVRSLLNILSPALICLLALNLGIMTFNRNFDYHSAAIIWQDTIDKRPNNARAYTSLGIELANNGQLEEAINHYNIALELNPRYLKCYGNRGNAYQLLDRYELALKDYEHVINLSPSDPRTFTNRGNLHARMGNYQLAIRDYTRAIQLDPFLAEAYNNRGSTYADLGKYDKAIADYNIAISLKNDFALAYALRADAYYHTKQYDKAWQDVHIIRQLGREPLPELIHNLENATHNN